ncbi:hypothetical protein L6164_011843 [Bauhinia variegata]|uniref:Uncharacterized protein n=1 Tax=Bauhinia variegata TaxID=167791 RepID=A0ACB9P863_BAUVA|nr:hypothetical protein L6164_011843 [Bauhinia variegata]
MATKLYKDKNNKKDTAMNDESEEGKSRIPGWFASRRHLNPSSCKPKMGKLATSPWACSQKFCIKKTTPLVGKSFEKKPKKRKRFYKQTELSKKRKLTSVT